MYEYPVGLNPFSNREDFNLSVALTDDDTGAFINLSGTIGAGTFSAWNVTDGQINTTSATQITIPQLPIGNQLSSLALTVGTGLAIVQGDPIVVTDAGTGQNQMLGYVLSYASATGALIVQIGCTLWFEIRRWARRSGSHGNGYVPWYDIGTACESPIITASLGNGILITDMGIAQIMIPASTFRSLHPETYICGLVITDSVNTRQLLVATLPVIQGVVMGAPPAQSASYNPAIF